MIFTGDSDSFPTEMMCLCLKGILPSKNLVILSDLNSDGLSVEANATTAPLPPADQTPPTYQNANISATKAKEQHVFQVSLAPPSS